MNSTLVNEKQKYGTIYMRKWRMENPEKVKASQIKSEEKRALKKPWLYFTERQKELRRERIERYRKAHPERNKEIQKKSKDKWMKENPGVAAQRMALFRKEHPDREKQTRAKYYIKNTEKVKALSQKWRKDNPLKVSLQQRNKRHRKMGAEGSHSLGEWEHLKALYRWTCPCCWKQEPLIKLTEDHVVPISKGGSNYIENIQPLCKSCNSKKHTKTIKFNITK